MPYPCCCRNENNGPGCFACDLERTPLQWTLSWPEWYVEYFSGGQYLELFRMPAGTHVMTQVEGGGVCCWSGPAFTVCTTTQGAVWTARMMLWGYQEPITTELRLTAGWQYTTRTPAQLCGDLGGNNRLGTVSWSKTTLAGCRAGPYSVSVAGQSRAQIIIYQDCPQRGTRYFTQIAGNAVLDDV